MFFKGLQQNGHILLHCVLGITSQPEVIHRHIAKPLACKSRLVLVHAAEKFCQIGLCNLIGAALVDQPFGDRPVQEAVMPDLDISTPAPAQPSDAL